MPRAQSRGCVQKGLASAALVVLVYLCTHAHTHAATLTHTTAVVNGDPRQQERVWIVDIDAGGLVRTGLKVDDDVAYLVLRGLVANSVAHAGGRATVALVTTVLGQVLAAQAAENMASLHQILGVAAEETPVRTGASTPLTWSATLEHNSATWAMAKVLREHPPNSVDIVALGALTNIAILFGVEPDVAARVRTLVIAGGDLNADAVAHADFNVQADPVAASMVARSSARKIMVPIQLALQMPLLWTDISAIASRPAMALHEYSTALQAAFARGPSLLKTLGYSSAAYKGLWSPRMTEQDGWVSREVSAVLVHAAPQFFTNWTLVHVDSVSSLGMRTTPVKNFGNDAWQCIAGSVDSGFAAVPRDVKARAGSGEEPDALVQVVRESLSRVWHTKPHLAGKDAFVSNGLLDPWVAVPLGVFVASLAFAGCTCCSIAVVEVLRCWRRKHRSEGDPDRGADDGDSGAADAHSSSAVRVPGTSGLRARRGDGAPPPTGAPRWHAEYRQWEAEEQRKRQRGCSVQ